MSETIVYVASKGVLFAPILVPVSGVIALAAGLSILLGYGAKFGAWLMAFFLVCVTPAMHNFWTVTDPVMHQIELIQFLKNVSMLGGALLITQVGSGPWSLDQPQK
jgi:putative oxidoreductase